MKKKFKLPVILFLSLSIFVLIFSFAFNSPIKTFIVNKTEVKAPANWYRDYTYTLNSSNRTITLTKYNGTATEVVVGSTATISGVTYKTVVQGNTDVNNSLFAKNENITKITFERGVKAAPVLDYLFAYCTNLKEVVFNNFDTSETTSLKSLFLGCSSLTNLDVSMFDTRNVTNMHTTFSGCTSLTELDLSNWNTSNVRTMYNMFSNDSKIKKLDISNFDTSSITSGNFLSVFNSLQPDLIKIGPKTDFHIRDDKKGYTILRGIYKKVDGINAGSLFDGIDIMEHAGVGSSGNAYAGTYEKYTNITDKMIIDQPITYRLSNFDNNNTYVSSSNNFTLQNNKVYFKNITKPTSADYSLPGWIEVTSHDSVTDALGNSYDLKIRIDNIKLYDFNTFPSTNIYIYLMNLWSSGISLGAHAYSDEQMTAQVKKDIKYDVTIQVLDKDGAPVQGSLIFSAYDFDQSSVRDNGYGPYSEGINIYEGIDIDSIKLYPNTYLNIEDNRPSYYRITGSRNDNATEMSEFTAIADASKIKFAYTGGSCGTGFFNYYQPRIVEIEKQDSKGNTLPGANLQLYKNDNVDAFESWVSSTSSEKLFLNPGKYRVVETEAPLGYEKSSPITFYADINDELSLDGNKVDKIVVVNYEKPATLVVKYVDENGNDIDPTKNRNESVHWWDDYDSEQLTFTNYEFVKTTGDPTSGTINRDEVEVIYHYKLKEAKLVVKYVDENGDDIDANENIDEDVHYGDTYTSDQLSFTNYDFVNQTGDAPSGVIDKDEVEVIYHYVKKGATLVVRYVDQDGNDIDPTKNRNENVHWGDGYISTQLIFTNYNFVNQTGDAPSGTINKDNVEVIYHYKLKDANLVVKYVDENGNDIDPTKNRNESVHYGDTYTSSQLTFTNYNFVERTGDPASGTIAKDNVEIIYHYQIKEATLVVKYVDENGNNIDPSQNRNENVHWGDSYTSSQLAFTNYDFVNQTGDAPSGTISKNSYEIIYHYKLKDATLVVRYVDQDGNDIDPARNRNESVHWGDGYISTQYTFANYSFVEQTGDNPSGIIAKDHVEVIYHYKLKEATLTIKYVDENGNSIDPTKDTINAPKHYGDTYNSSQLTFTNYVFVRVTGDEPNGTVSKDHVEVIYHYRLCEAVLSVRYVDQDGYDIDVTKNRNEEVHYGDTYTTSQLTFTNYNFVDRTGDPASGTIGKDLVEVIYHYALKDATLVVRYVDENGNDIDPSQNRNENVHWGDTYTSSQLTFTNYNFVERTGDAASGIISKNSYEIVYHYKLKSATLVVKYVDENGNDIDPSQNRNENVHWGDTYTSSQKTFTNYDFVNQTGDAPSGTISKNSYEIIYHYKLKDATLVVKYVDQDGHDIDPTKNRNEAVHWGDAYISTQLIFTNYNFVNQTGDAPSGIISKNHVEIIYHYKLKDATLVVRYVDQDGHDIDPARNRNESVHYGDTYTSSQLTFTNYNFVERTGDPASGTIANDNVEIIYHYQIKESTLVVKYVDEDGHDIDPSQNRNENVHWGDTYTSSQLTFTNYNFVNQTGDAPSGTISKNSYEIIYHYKLKDATLVVKYVDQDGNDIDPTKNRNESVHWGDGYISTQLIFTNYNFVNQTGDAPSGIISKNHVEIIYHYKLKDANLVVKYVDENGNDIDPSQNRNENVHWGDSYTSEQKTFNNYSFVNHTGDAPSGTISKNSYEIIYHYKIKDAILVVRYVDEDGNDIDPTKNRNENVHWGDSYTSSQLSFDYYRFVEVTGDAPSGTISKNSYEIIYHYAKVEAVLNVRYVDQDGNDIDITKNRSEAVHYGDTYSTEQLSFQNYDFVNQTGDAPSGTINKDNVEVVYQYKIKSATLVVRYVDEAGNDIDPTKNRNEAVHWGDTYTSSQMTFTNYNFVNQTGDAPSGTISKNSYEIIYHYKLKDATLVVRYVDQDGNDIDPTRNRNESVHWGDAYVSTQLIFTNYNFVNQTGDVPSGVISKNNYEIIYHYKLKDATLVVRYVDEAGHDIDPSQNRNENVHWGDSYTSVQKEFNDYQFVRNEGDPINGIISKNEVEVRYVYKLKGASLVVKYVDENGNDIDPSQNRNESVHWGDSYTSVQKEFNNYQFVRNEGDPTSGTIAKNEVVVKYIYKLKGATLVVRYVDEAGHDIDPSQNRNESVHWGDSYTSVQKEFTNYNFVNQTGDAPSGTISKNNYEIIYHYKLKDATLVVKYVDQDGNNIDSDKNRNEAVHWGDSYTSTQLTFEYYDFVNHTGDPASGTISKNSYEIIYHYKLKQGVVVTHHYLYDNGETTTELANDVSNSYNYTTMYETEVSQDVTSNYELYKKSDNFRGEVKSPRIDVYYYYQLKDSSLDTQITKEGPEKITSKDEQVNYKITYNASIKDYIGDGTITIIDTLPFKIDENKSDIAGGTYDESNQTITWVEEWNGINSYSSSNETATKEVVKNIKLVFEGIDGRDRIIVNSVKGKIEVSNNSREIENQTSTDVKIEGKIIVRYVDEEDKDLIERIEKSGLVGDSFNSEEREFEGYELIEKPSKEHLEFEEEEQLQIYKYKRLIYEVRGVVLGGGGSIKGDEDVYWGEDSTKDNIVIQADEGYIIDSIIINGVEIKIDKGQEKLILNQFIKMTENKEIEVRFVKKPDNPPTGDFISTMMIVILLILGMFILRTSNKFSAFHDI